MTQHTKGPWHTGGKDNRIVYDEDGWAVCDCTVHHSESGLERMQGNARLIAASPALLEALQFIVSEDHPPFGSRLAERINEARAMAHAAIAQATGGAA